MNAKKVIIDCDPGIDDTLALMLALSSPELDVLGITVVSGNVPVEKGAKNALKVLDWMNRKDIPVYLGEPLPLVRNYVDAMDTHGDDGLGESNYPTITDIRPHTDAVGFLRDTLLHTPHVSVIALGPLTNLARLYQISPEAFAQIEEMVSMGGNYKSHGNCSPVAEYNYWCDPDAAHIVYEAFASMEGKLLHMIGLDVTRQIVLTPNILQYMRYTNPVMGERITNITKFYLDFHWKQEGIIGCVINDPLAVAYFIDRNLCQGFASYATVETQGISIGQTLVDTYHFWNKPDNSYILTQTDAYGFMKFFLQRVINAPESEIERILKTN